MKQSLQLRLGQHLALTPQLQQSIRLLQLSTLELSQELDQALADNPMLERLDDPFEHCERISPNGGMEHHSSAGDTPAEAPAASTDSPGEAEAPQGGESDTWNEQGEGAGDYGDRSSGSRSDNGEDDPGFAQIAAAEDSLRDHLSAQLAATRCSPTDRALVAILIDEVNQDGYLEVDPDEFLGMLPEELEIDRQSVSAAFKLIQSFDPPGVGARNVSECLMLQLSDREQAQVSPPPDVLDLARNLVRDHLPALAARDFAKIKRLLRCDDDLLRNAQQLIRSLNPRPGSAFASEAPVYVAPDVIVRRVSGEWTAVLNPSIMPRLRVNDMYASVIRSQRGEHPGLSGQLQEARWLIKNIKQRFETILRVAQAIVERQRGFFTHGAVAMRPLVLREIADVLGLHESTISRVTTQKFMLTPFGTYELKYFFGSHVATESGGAASSTAIRELIRQLIQAEDAKAPLSDSHLAELLGEQGIKVARRTVAKYREGLRIPAVAQRKVL